ncbi:NAD-dependent epimerase/dehydratase family protein [Parasphingorhabdus cellanae]|uniref:NAD(P)-dependent oxidoreductase n=1 Tax=Parasphingorhabdus cellanae TaxID=2806553 RepID=A0ABX7T6A4_9SPHN|nr:NAD(P)-dependent oxidoreductase [Parasphingorhabdus cellanae]QTD57141.1 NAD(P)-dependent oxidoreductase [Parasphingorhabdus cellanae]
MKLLLTGSSGWLGRFLAPRLEAIGHKVVGLDVAPGEYTNVNGSVADRPLIDKTFSDHGIEAVIHAGALHKPDIVRYPNSAFVDVNVTGTLNLLEAAAQAGHDRFVFTSTTSLMISEAVRAGRAGGAEQAVWLDEEFGPLKPRNIYGVTKISAEHLCRLYHKLHGINVAVLRTGRFFPEDDDTLEVPSGPNLKANEFLNRRLTVEDAAQAHVAALDAIADLGFETFILSAPTLFAREDCKQLMENAPSVIARYFPEAADLYHKKGWVLPDHIDRIYDPGKAERLLGFRGKTEFASILEALADDRPMPFHHDPSYISPKEAS